MPVRKFIMFWLLLAGCNPDKSADQGKQVYEPAEEWWTYEGVVRTDSGNDIMMELSLMQGAVGVPSSYRTIEEYVSFEDRITLASRGKYTILLGSSDVGNIIEIRNKKNRISEMSGPSFTSDRSEYSKQLYKQAAISSLTFKTSEFGDLVQVDDSHNPIATDDRYTLKRRSGLYTVKGFITLDSDAPDFYELNTHQTWSVLRAGAFGEAKAKLLSMDVKSGEEIYLEAIAFFVETRDEQGRKAKTMVIKRIISMKSKKQLSGG